MSIDLKMPDEVTTDWRTLFSLQTTKSFSLRDGSHILALFVQLGQSNVEFMINYNIEANLKYTFKTKTKSNGNKWTNIKIRQINGFYEIMINNKFVKRTDVSPREITNSYLLTRESFAQYRNFEIKTCMKGKTIKFKNLLFGSNF